jgi:hypothetical protein
MFPSKRGCPCRKMLTMPRWPACDLTGELWRPRRRVFPTLERHSSCNCHSFGACQENVARAEVPLSGLTFPLQPRARCWLVDKMSIPVMIRERTVVGEYMVPLLRFNRMTSIWSYFEGHMLENSDPKCFPVKFCQNVRVLHTNWRRSSGASVHALSIQPKTTNQTTSA